MPKWEYKVMPWVEYESEEQFDQRLNDLGQHEWELVQATQQGNKIMAIMKKPIAETGTGAVAEASGDAGGAGG